MQDDNISNIVPFRKPIDAEKFLADVDEIRNFLTRNIWDVVLTEFATPIADSTNTYCWSLDRRSHPYTRTSTAVRTFTVAMSQAETWVDQPPEEKEWRTFVIQSGFMLDFPATDAGQEWANAILIERCVATHAVVSDSMRSLLFQVNQELNTKGTPYLCYCEVNGEYTVITHLFIDGVFSRLMYTNGIVDADDVPFFDPQFAIPLLKEIIANGKPEAP